MVFYTRLKSIHDGNAHLARDEIQKYFLIKMKNDAKAFERNIKALQENLKHEVEKLRFEVEKADHDRKQSELRAATGVHGVMSSSFLGKPRRPYRSPNANSATYTAKISNQNLERQVDYWRDNIVKHERMSSRYSYLEGFAIFWGAGLSAFGNYLLEWRDYILP